MIKLIKLTFLLSLGLTLIGSGYFYAWTKNSLLVTPEKKLLIKTGTNLSKFATQLEQNDIITNAFAFKVYGRFFKDFKNVKAGTYLFKGLVSPSDVFDKIIAGDVDRELILSLTIPPGFTLDNTIKRLAKKEIDSYENMASLVRDVNFIKSLGVEALSLEGYLLPETYLFFDTKPSAETVFKRLVNDFLNSVPSGYRQAVKKMGLSFNEAVTFASLIELETKYEEEKPLISEVIWNRLNANMQLGIDAAIIYGIENYQGDLKWIHLKDKKNPFNTRIHRGLPPSPIGSVSVSSLKAVLTPSNSGYFYYVLLPNSDGRHKFSKTLKEHNKYVKKLVEHSKTKK